VAPPPAPPKPKRFKLDNRFLAPILITGILLVGEFAFRILESYWWTLLAIVSSIAMELVLGRLITRKWPHLASAYITGISVGILIRSLYFWPYILCSALSITSKYAIRFRGRHLWNPSNLGVSIMLLLVPAAVAPLSQQWDNRGYAMLVIWALGCFTIWRLRRFHICVTYVATFLLFSWIRCLVTGQSWLMEVQPITGPMYQLFIFFMITDPKTTVSSKWGQCFVAFLVGVVEALLRLTDSPQVQDALQSLGLSQAVLGSWELRALALHAPFFALFFVGPLAYFIEICWKSPKAAGSVPAAPASQGGSSGLCPPEGGKGLPRSDGDGTVKL
jgi:Na+-translocating ferredoxin:NAD+ oxidoreductase RnfD subunit